MDLFNDTKAPLVASGFQTNTGGSAGFNVQVGAKGLNTFAVYDANIGRFIENFYNQARAQSRQFQNIDSAGPGPSITAEENAEIDAAIASGKAIPAIPFKGKAAFDQAADAYINPIPILRDVWQGLPPSKPSLIPVPKSRTIPTVVDAAPPPPRNLPAGPSWQIPGASSYPSQPDPNATQKVCFDMNLSGLLSGVSSIANTIGGLASTYYSVKNLGKPPMAAAPPAITPRAPVQASFPSYQTNLPQFQTAQYQPAGGFQAMTTGGLPIAIGGTALARSFNAGLLGKALAIAGTLGLSIDVVQAVLGEANHKHRRKRLLTKSDVADISTMASLLGKNSESFKTWLAVSRR